MKSVLSSFKRSVILRLIAFCSILLAGLLTLIFLLESSTYERLLRNSLLERARLAARLSSSSLDEGLRSRDDVALLQGVSALMAAGDVAAAYVLDGAGKVLIHNDTRQWGKVLTDSRSRAALLAKQELVQREAGRQVLVYSLPLAEGVLCLELSTQKSGAQAHALRVQLFVFSGILFLGAAALYTLFVRRSLGMKFGRLDNYVKAMAMGSAEQEAALAADEDEFGRLRRAVSEALVRRQPPAAKAAEDGDGARRLLQALVESSTDGLVILDGDNRIRGVNAKAKELLRLPAESAGKHILEMPLSSVILEALKEASECPDIPAIKTADTGYFRVLTLPGAGTVITIRPIP